MTGRLNITAIRARARNGYSDLRTARADVIRLLSFAVRLDRRLFKMQTDRVAAQSKPAAGAWMRWRKRNVEARRAARRAA